MIGNVSFFNPYKLLYFLSFVSISCFNGCSTGEINYKDKPNIILIMSDDQGWGQVGYYDHPILKTPHLDEMAQNGLRLDRFYAGSPLCSPTRATVLTGRASDRTAVYSHGYPMRVQEKTIAQALKADGYHTAHFGKWHLNGLKGPGVPVFKEDKRNPGAFGYDEWITVTNFFDVNPLMGHKGIIKEYEGSSSEIIVDQAIDYISAQGDEPFFVTIWYGSPHDPWTALERDKEDLPSGLDDKHKEYLGEIVELDKSIGKLRSELRKKGLAQNTLLWFNSDNGGLPEGGKEGVGGLRGFKRSVYEGGLRVPCVIEWPEQIQKRQVSKYPASTMDIFPTIAAILNLDKSVMTKPIDGESILPIFDKKISRRDNPIPFKFRNTGALVGNDYKLIVEDIEEKKYALYNIKSDKTESEDILSSDIEKGKEMISWYETWLESVTKSMGGKDYKDGLLVADPESVFWWDTQEYAPYIEKWKDRPEYNHRLKKAGKI